MEWVPFWPWMVVGLVLVALSLFATAKFGKRKFRRRKVKVNGKWAHFVTLDGGKQWFQFYWDKDGVAHIMLAPDQEAVATFTESLAKEMARCAERDGKPRDDFLA